jgi:IPT/TIG domain
VLCVPAVLAMAMLLPGPVQATTVTVGVPEVPMNAVKEAGCGPCGSGETLAPSFSPLIEDVTFAPGAGLIKSWRVVGFGAVRLQLLESGLEGGWLGVGTSAAATNLAGQPNPTSLPTGSDDLIGVDLGPGGSGTVGWVQQENAETLEFPLLANDGAEHEQTRAIRGERLLLSAEEILAPVVSSISTASGGTVGGTAVKITGLYLDGATSVTFGAVPASSFSVYSLNQITAIAPPSTASTVDVRVTGPGGSSEVTPADRYTFTAPPPIATTPTNPLSGVLESAIASTPAITGFSQSTSRWKRGGSLARVSSVPVGTTFTFTLNEPALASLSFTRSVAGRRVRGHCVVLTHANVGKQRCKRNVSAGSLPVSAHAGANRVRFQGRLSSAKALQPGAYGVTIVARDSHGQQSPPQALSFTIVSG